MAHHLESVPIEAYEQFDDPHDSEVPSM